MSNKKIKIVKPSLENRNSLCPFDFCQLISFKLTSVVYNDKTERILTKQCPMCNRKYIHVPYFKDLKKIGIGEIDYYNLNLEEGYIRDKLIIVSKPGDAQTVYKRNLIKVLDKKTERDKTQIGESRPVPIIKPYRYSKDNTSSVINNGEKKISCYVVDKTKLAKVCKNCGSEIEKGFIVKRNKKGKEYNTPIKVCVKCGAVHIAINHFELFKDVLECKNINEVYAIRKAREENELQKRKELLTKQGIDNESSGVKGAKIISKELPLPKYANENKNKQVKPKQTKPVRRTIQIKDFIVRRSAFICMHKEHSLQNIDAVIRIVTNKGEITDATVSAGYCQDCNTYFIMESTYQMLKNKGTPLCRVSDEKTYLKGNVYANGMKLASESLLMQFGYNVSQQEGLTETRRHKILAVLIDNKIMTKSEIISYLDFFINQRQGRSMYEVAIHKWSTDRDFVEEYRNGSYTRVGISGILR